MKHISKKIGLILLTLFLLIAAHTHAAMAEEVEMINNTPKNYVIEYTTWSTDSWNHNGQKLYLHCAAKTTCRTQPNTDPDDTGSMGIALTGYFKIWENGKSGTIISQRGERPKNDRGYRCSITAYMQGQKPVIAYYDH